MLWLLASRNTSCKKLHWTWAQCVAVVCRACCLWVMETCSCVLWWLSALMKYVPQSEPSSWAIKVYTHLCLQLQVFVALCTRTRIEVRQWKSVESVDECHPTYHITTLPTSRRIRSRSMCSNIIRMCLGNHIETQHFLLMWTMGRTLRLWI